MGLYIDCNADHASDCDPWLTSHCHTFCRDSTKCVTAVWRPSQELWSGRHPT